MLLVVCAGVPETDRDRVRETESARVRAGGRGRCASGSLASAEHRDLFATNPARYAPAYGGFCAYGIAYETEPKCLEEERGDLAGLARALGDDQALGVVEVGRRERPPAVRKVLAGAIT